MQTCLPAGTYCDIVSGDVVDGSCSGKSFMVSDDGTADISILTTDTNGFVAFHIASVI